MRPVASLIVACLLSTTALAGDNVPPERLQAATELLQVTDAERAAQASSEATVDNLIKAQPMMAPFRGVIMQWSAEYVSWKQLEPQLAALYAAAFTKSELEDLIHFYKTPTGHKAAEVIPGLMKQAIAIGTQAAQQHIPELQQMIRARAAELQKTSQGH